MRLNTQHQEKFPFARWAGACLFLGGLLAGHGLANGASDGPDGAEVQNRSQVDSSASDQNPVEVSTRFATGSEETPSFQRHVSPLFGRLGCNGRSCHGSFQGQGGFQLSLFGYDFTADHQALMADGSGRIDLEDAEESLVLTKPVDADGHGGGKRFELKSWEYNLLRNWIAGGAEGVEAPEKLAELRVIPSALDFSSRAEHKGSAIAEPQQQLQVLARWADGTEEDVTALARFQSKDPALAEVNERGLVTAGDSGDTHIIVSYDNAVVPVAVYRPFGAPIARNRVTETPASQIDRLVQAKLDRLGLERSPLADDLTFLRRVSLDICGTLPTPEEIKRFALDNRADKRERKIAELLESPAYSAYWTTFLCDITGNNSQELRDVSLNSELAPQLWYDWIYDRVRRNAPYDEIVRGMVLGRSRPED